MASRTFNPNAHDKVQQFLWWLSLIAASVSIFLTFKEILKVPKNILIRSLIH